MAVEDDSTGQASLTPSTLAPAPAKPSANSLLTSKGRWMFRILDVCAVVFWLYVILKIFFFDADVFLLQWAFPTHAWLLNLRFIFMLVALALTLIFFDKESVLLGSVYIIFFPLIILLWKIPRMIYKRPNWVLVIAFANAVISFFTSFKYNILIAAGLFAATAIALLSSSEAFLWTAIALALVALYAGYARRFISAVRPSKVFRAHEKLVSWLSNIVTASAPEPTIRAARYSKPTDEHAQQWTATLQNSVLASRLCLFSARKLKEYHASGAGFFSAAFVVLFLVVVTVFVFADANLALFKISPGYFAFSETPSFFTFIYYSFKAVIFSNISELMPVGGPAKILWMIEAASALFFGLIFASLMFSARSQRQTEELNKVIETISEQGRSMELFVLTEYKFQTIDEALSELARLKAAFVSFIYKLSP